MRNLLIALTSVLILGCTTYSSGDLNGKWECTIEDEHIELWISDSLAIGFNIDNQLMNTYEVDYNHKILTFNFIDHMQGSAPWKVEILSLTDNEFITELQHPSNREISIYKRISKETPKISANSEINWERYEGYMRSKIDSR